MSPKLISGAAGMVRSVIGAARPVWCSEHGYARPQ